MDSSDMASHVPGVTATKKAFHSEIIRVGIVGAGEVAQTIHVRAPV